MSMISCDGYREISKKNISMPIIHECYGFGHIWKLIEDTFYLTSVCRICGKIGERKRK